MKVSECSSVHLVKQILSKAFAEATVIKVESLSTKEETVDYTLLRLTAGHLIKVSSDHPIGVFRH